VDLPPVSDRSLANLDIAASATSGSGGLADGVLGSYDHAGGLTLILGWSWYVGADPAGIGPGEFDLQTVVIHELGHAIGLGHSQDAASAMHAALAPGAIKRTLSAADLNVRPAEDEGPSPLLAAGIGRADAAPSVPGSVVTGGLAPVAPGPPSPLAPVISPAGSLPRPTAFRANAKGTARRPRHAHRIRPAMEAPSHPPAGDLAARPGRADRHASDATVRPGRLP
jgi:hypothetical protein